MLAVHSSFVMAGQPAFILRLLLSPYLRPQRYTCSDYKKY